MSTESVRGWVFDPTRFAADREWLTFQQTAQRLGVSTQRVHQLIHKGRIAYENTPNGRLYDARSVARVRGEIDASVHGKAYARRFALKEQLPQTEEP